MTIKTDQVANKLYNASLSADNGVAMLDCKVGVVQVPPTFRLENHELGKYVYVYKL